MSRPAQQPYTTNGIKAPILRINQMQMTPFYKLGHKPSSRESNHGSHRPAGDAIPNATRIR
jgi:hypothetical protein